MKKLLKRFSGGIINKLFLLILITVLLCALAFFSITGYQNKMLSDLNIETSNRQQTAIADTTVSVMKETILNTLNQTTRLKALSTDEIFRSAKARVTLLQDYATKMYAHPEFYTSRSYSGPDPSLNGQLVAQVIFADGVDLTDPDVNSAIGLTANMSGLMISVCRSLATDNAYIAIPEGAFLSVSRESASWFKDGSLISYDARTRFWYKQAVEAGELIFTDVEEDANTGELSLVCAVPVYGPDGQLRAVIGTDLFLNSMQQSMRESDGNNGYHLVVNREGHVVASSLNGSEFRTETSENAPDLRESKNEELAAFVRNVLKGKTDVSLVHLNNEAFYMAGVPVETVGWAMISVFNETTTTDPANALIRHFQEIEQDGRDQYRKKDARLKLTLAIILIVLLLVLSIAALIQGKTIVRPLNTMTRTIAGLRDDQIEFKMDDAYRTGDEIEILADSFARLTHKTVDYIRQVRTATAEKERISAELHTASNIQSSMLPHIFPAFPDRTEFELYASMDPAKEVGGDFYDFFLIDDDHLGIVIADVSGKGIPAALFMMIAKVTLQNCALMGRSPAETLKATNEALCSNNQEDMFVTVWLGILETSTGKLTAANAGHEYPALMRAGGRFELFRDKHGFVVGGMRNIRFSQYELQLNPGDRLFVYTDGVPEATNADKELFGTDRMLTALNEVKDAPPEDVLKGVRQSVDAFVKDAEQFDDLTMLCLTYKGSRPSA